MGVAYYLANLVDIDHLQLHLREAAEKLDQAVSIFEYIGDTRGLATTLSLYASNALSRGDIEQAGAKILRVIKGMGGPATKLQWGYFLNKPAKVQILPGQTTLAKATWQRAIAMADVSNNNMMNFEMHTNLAHAQIADGDAPGAKQTLQGSPCFDGLSIWTLVDRDLVDCCVLIGSRDMDQTACLAAQISQHSRSWPYYQRIGLRLENTIQNNLPVSSFPGLLWLGDLSGPFTG
jgi:hypothetical protein